MAKSGSALDSSIVTRSNQVAPSNIILASHLTKRAAFSRIIKCYAQLVLSAGFRQTPTSYAYALYAGSPSSLSQQLKVATLSSVVSLIEPVQVSVAAHGYSYSGQASRDYSADVPMIFLISRAMLVSFIGAGLTLLLMSQVGPYYLVATVSNPEVFDQALGYAMRYTQFLGSSSFVFMIGIQQIAVGAQKPWIEMLSNVCGSTTLILMSHLHVLNAPSQTTSLAESFALRYAVAAFAAYFMLAASLTKEQKLFPKGASFKSLVSYFFSRENKKPLIDLMLVGLPFNQSLFAETSSFMLRTMLLSWLPPEENDANVLAFSVFLQFHLIFRVCFSVPVKALAASEMGSSLEKKQFEDARLLMRVCLQVVAMTAVLVSTFFLAFPNVIIQLFFDVEEPLNRPALNIIENRFTLSILSAALSFEKLGHALSGCLSAGKRSRWVGVAGFSGYWLTGLPASALFGIVLKGGLAGIFGGYMLGMVVFFAANAFQAIKLDRHLLSESQASQTRLVEVVEENSTPEPLQEPLSQGTTVVAFWQAEPEQNEISTKTNHDCQKGT
jgi:Na+-driven multidrug efflux pump